MANRHRGEIEVTLDGTPYTLCLTLGALAELEQAFEVDSLLSMVERFEKGEMKASDAIEIIAAGLHGGGNNIPKAEVAKMRVEGGAKEYVRIVAALLNATFAEDANGASGE